jgi:hypothetical protein
MASGRFCAFNKTRGIILSLDVAVIDAALDPLRVLRVLMEGLDSEPSTGLWLTHFRAVPVARAVSPFDLIYLDKDHTAVHATALTVDSAFEPFEGEPASALVLPPSIIAASQTQAGDQLVIVASPEGARLSKPPEPVSAEPVEQPQVAASTAVSHTQPAEAESPADAALARYLSGQAHLAPAPASTPAQTPPVPATPAEMPQVSATAAVEEPKTAPPAPAPKAPPAAPVRPVEYYRAPKLTLRTRVMRWLQQQPEVPVSSNRALDRRRAYRLSRPDLVAYFFTGGAPRPHRIENISVTGFLMQTDDLWMPGTVIRMTLQKMGTRGDRPGDSITVHSRMVRRAPGGGAFEFVLSGFLDEPYRR